jgi:hypothetical protein
MLRAAIAVIGLCGLATPSLATEWVNCSDAAGAASFSYLAGTLEVLSVVAVTASAGERVWASDVAYGPGEPIVVGQAFDTGDTILIDAMDGAVNRIVARLRLFRTTEGQDIVLAGTLQIPGEGVWAVSCSGP